MLVGILLALSAGACFGLANVVGRIAISRSSVYTTALWSLLPSAVVLPFAVFALVINGTIGPTDLASAPFFVGAGISGDFVARLSLIGAVARLGAARAVAFRVLAPLVSIALGLLVLGERLSWKMMVGVVLMLTGVGFVQYDALRRQREPIPEDVLEDPDPGGYEALPRSMLEISSGHARRLSTKRRGRSDWIRVGLAFGLLAGLSFGVADVFRKAGVNAEGHPAFGAFVSTVAGMILYFTFALKKGLREHFLPQRGAFLSLVATGTTTLFAVVLFLSALQRIPVSLGSTISGTQVLFAMVFGWLINQTVEQVSLQVVVGGAITFSGFALVVG